MSSSRIELLSPPGSASRIVESFEAFFIPKPDPTKFRPIQPTSRVRKNNRDGSFAQSCPPRTPLDGYSRAPSSALHPYWRGRRFRLRFPRPAGWIQVRDLARCLSGYSRRFLQRMVVGLLPKLSSLAVPRGFAAAFIIASSPPTTGLAPTDPRKAALSDGSIRWVQRDASLLLSTNPTSDQLRVFPTGKEGDCTRSHRSLSCLTLNCLESAIRIRILSLRRQYSPLTWTSSLLHSSVANCSRTSPSLKGFSSSLQFHLRSLVRDEPDCSRSTFFFLLSAVCPFNSCWMPLFPIVDLHFSL